MFKLIDIKEDDIQKNIDKLPELMDYMEQYIISKHRTLKLESFEKQIYCLEHTTGINRDIRVMHAYDDEYFNCKVLGGIDTSQSTKIDGINILFDVKKMEVVSIVDGCLITGLRTAAINGIALQHLSPNKVSNILIIGCGCQSIFQVPIILSLFNNSHIFVFDEDARKMNRLLNIYHPKCSIKSVKNLHDILRLVDVIITLTPSIKPLLFKSQIKSKVHISAIGADTKGKQEIDYEILKDAKIIVDDIDQSLSHGELNIPYTNEILRKNDIYATILEVIIGNKKGRENDDDITVFDSSGIPIQDLIAHRWIYEMRYSKDDRLIEG